MTAQTSPKDFLGHAIGEDFFLADYTQLVSYWRTLERETDRVKLVDIGETAYGRRQYMLVISSPENLSELDGIRRAARALAQPYDLDAEAAAAIAASGKTILFIDGGVHFNEILPTQALFEQAWRMASGTDSETLRILDEVVLLLVHANPDGHEDFVHEYMREADPARRPVEWRFAMPRLMPKYAGGEINRDYHVMRTVETANVNAVLYRDWFAQVAYDPHQTGPLGVAMYIPPFRDPNNRYTHPIVVGMSNEMGLSAHNRLVAEGKPGTYMGTAAPYSLWSNGSSTSTSQLHNIFAIFTEVIGTPHPQRVPFVPARQMPGTCQPVPLEPRLWHASDGLAYQLSAHRAVLDWAARNRERILMAHYFANRSAIEAGTRDSWTRSARQMEALDAAARAAQRRPMDAFDRAAGLHIGNLRGWQDTDAGLHESVLRDPGERDPRGFVIPAGQDDFPNAVDFANMLIRGGVVVERATQDFSVGDRRYPSGSLVIRTNQPYRPHILDMFEPHYWPSAPAFAGGPPQLPYDAAGSTVALAAGVVFDRILDGFDGPFERFTSPIALPPGSIHACASAAGVVFGCETNSAHRLVNRLHKAGCEVARLTAPFSVAGKLLRPGAFWTAYDERSRDVLERNAPPLGIDLYELPAAPEQAAKLMPRRIAVYDRFGGIRTSGWLQWLFDAFEFPYSVVFPGDMSSEGWFEQFDVLFLSDGAVRSERPRKSGEPVDVNADYSKQYVGARIDPDDVPAEYRNRLGDPDQPEVLGQLSKLLGKGGTIVAAGSSVFIAEALGLDLPEHAGRPFVPMSVVEARVDPSQPLAWGLSDSVNLVFNKSPLLDIPAGGTPVCWFEGERSIVSGFALRGDELEGGAAAVDVAFGGGRLVLLGPEFNFRGQSSGAFKILFNAAWLSSS